MATVTQPQPDLDRLTRQIVSAVDPSRIILLGSQARGTAGAESDIDLLIIRGRPAGTGWSRRREIGAIRRGLARVGVPIDILLFTPEEVERWKDTTNHVVSIALKEGKVLYERP